MVEALDIMWSDCSTSSAFSISSLPTYRTKTQSTHTRQNNKEGNTMREKHDRFQNVFNLVDPCNVIGPIGRKKTRWNMKSHTNTPQNTGSSHYQVLHQTGSFSKMWKHVGESYHNRTTVIKVSLPWITLASSHTVWHDIDQWKSWL